MRPAEYVDDIDVDQFGDYWLLIHEQALDHGSVRISDDGGRTWTPRRGLPTHNDSAGSKGRVVAFGPQSAVVTQFDANGPVAWVYRTNDAGVTWQQILRGDFIQKP